MLTCGSRFPKDQRWTSTLHSSPNACVSKYFRCLEHHNTGCQAPAQKPVLTTSHTFQPQQTLELTAINQPHLGLTLLGTASEETSI